MPTAAGGLFCFACFIYTCFWSLSYSLPQNEAGCACKRNDVLSSTTCECMNIPVADLHELFAAYHSELCDATNSPIHLRLYNLYQLRNLTESLQTTGAYTACNFSNIVNLTVIGTGIVSLHIDSFRAFDSLTELQLSHNTHLVSYGDGVFQHMGNSLVTLIASDNPVRSLGRNTFNGLTRLSKLVLSRNKIGYLDSGLFSRNCCSHLRELRLDHNILTVLEAEVLSGLISLEVLDMRYNPIQQIDREAFLPCASTLIELRMSHDDQTPFGGFGSLPSGVFSHLNRLAVLQMTDLKITNLTSEMFRGLSRLTYLSLKGNRLAQLPSDLFSPLKRLEHLDLSANKLSCVSSLLNPAEKFDFLAGLPLRYVDLSWNLLTHLNQLTTRSLGLFNPPPSDGSRLILNLTGNPWQHIDADTFCNPYSAGSIRPTDLIVTPPVGSPLGRWRYYLGLWYARALWPIGPLSLIGSSSRVYGLMLKDTNDSSKYRSVPITDEDIQTFGDYTSVVRGAPDAVEQCQVLRSNNGFSKTDKMNPTSPYKLLEKIRIPTVTMVAFSLASYCPRLPIHELSDWEMVTLNLTDILAQFNHFNRSPFQVDTSSSRLYLLAVFGVCITLLLVALTVIMCYRAWSRKASLKYKDPSFTAYHPVASIETHPDKQLFLQKSQFPNPTLNGQLPNGGNNYQYVDGAISVATNGVSSVPANMTRPLIAQTHRAEKINRTHMRRRSRESDSTHLINTAPPCPRISGDRPKSDSDLEALTDAGTLTSLGVV